MKQVTRKKRRKRRPAALAVLLAGMLVMQTGVPAYAGDEVIIIEETGTLQEQAEETPAATVTETVTETPEAPVTEVSAETAEEPVTETFAEPVTENTTETAAQSPTDEGFTEAPTGVPLEEETTEAFTESPAGEGMVEEIEILTDGMEESADSEAGKRTVLSWSWIDTEELLEKTETGWILVLPGASRENPAKFQDVEPLLPGEISAVLREEDASGGETEKETVLTLDGWSCEDYPEEGAYEGSYTFTAELPGDCYLGTDAEPLEVTVQLGGIMLLAAARAASPTLDIADGNILLGEKNGVPCYYQTKNYVTLSDAYIPYTGTITITGSGAYFLSIDGGTHTVLMRNASIKPIARQDGGESGDCAVYIVKGSEVDLALEGTNEWKGSSSYRDEYGIGALLAGLRMEDSNLVISGEGNLKIQGGDSLRKINGVGCAGIRLSNSSLMMNGNMDVEVSGGDMSEEYSQSTPGGGVSMVNNSSFSFACSKLNVEGQYGIKAETGSTFVSEGELEIQTRKEAAVDCAGGSSARVEVPADSFARVKKGNSASGASATYEVASFSIASSRKYLSVSFGSDLYSLTLDGGTGAQGGGSYLPGTRVQLQAGTRDGYGFDHWEVEGGGSFENAKSADTVFTMPEGSVTVRAVFAELRTLTISGGKADGANTVRGIPGQKAEITLDQVPEGKAFLGWILEGGGSLSDTGSSTTVYTFGDKDGTVTARIVGGTACGDFVVSGTDSSYTYEDGELSINGSGTYSIWMKSGVTSTSDHIRVGDRNSPTIILRGVQITAGGSDSALELGTSTGTVTLKLEGANKLQKTAGNSGNAIGTSMFGGGNLVITSLAGDGETSGSLEASSTITVTAIGNDGGTARCSNIEIRGGTITVRTDKNNRPAIGARGNVENIRITGGHVTATGGYGSVAIGSYNKVTSGIVIADNALIKQGTNRASEITDASAVVNKTKRYLEVSFGDGTIGSTVTGVGITPKEAEVVQGETQQFSAEVSGGSNANKNVNWFVSGNTSASTKMENGLLTVGGDEKAEQLTVTVTSQANGQKTASAVVTVLPSVITLTEEQMELTMEGWTYGGTPAKPQASVTGVEGDFAVTYSYRKEGSQEWTEETPSAAGNYQVRALFRSETHEGEKTAGFTIEKAVLTPVAAVLSERSYDTTKAVSVTEVSFDGLVNGDTLAVGTDYTAEAAYEDADAGTDKPASVTMALNESSAAAANYRLDESSLTASGTVHPKEVTTPVIQLDAETYEYTGSAVEPRVLSVKDADAQGSGYTVIPENEYTVEYAGNGQPGTGTVRIVNREGGNYTVSGSVTFTIFCLHSQGCERDSEGVYRCVLCGTQMIASVTAGEDTSYYEDIHTAWRAAQGNTAVVTLLADAETGEVLTVTEGSNITLQSDPDYAEHTLLGNANETNGGLINITGGMFTLAGGTVQNGGNGSNAIAVSGGGSFVMNGGTVEALADGHSGICVYSGGTAEIHGGSASGYNGLAIVNGGSGTVSGGTFTGTFSVSNGSAAVLLRNVGSTTLKSILEPGRAYYSGTNVTAEKLITDLTGRSLTGTVTVGECRHTCSTWTDEKDGANHSGSCVACGQKVTEPHNWDTDGHCKAEGCTAQATAYTITIPKTAAAGGEPVSVGINTEEMFNLNGGTVSVSVSGGIDENGKLTLTNTDSSKSSVTSEMYVGESPITSFTDRIFAVFESRDDSPVSLSFKEPTETDILAGTYEGTVTFSIDYTAAEGGTTE